MAIVPQHRYSNKAERPSLDNHDGFRLKKKIFGLHGLYKNI